MELEAIGQKDRGAETQDSSANEAHLLDVLIILSKRRKLIFLITIGAAVLSTVVVLLMPNWYTATTLILPPNQNSSGTALLSQLGSTGSLVSAAGASLGMKNPGDMYVSLLRSRTVEDSVIQRFGLMERYHKKKMSDARAAFEVHSKVTLGAKDGLITISVTDHDPQQVSELANGYIEEFRKFSANLAITEASQRRLFFQQQLLEAKENLATAEEAMKGTEQSTGVFQIDSQTRELIESVAALRAQVVAKEVQLQGMRSYATEDNPEMLQAKQQLAALQAQLARLGGTDQDSGLIVPKGKVSEAGLAYIRKLRDVKYYDTISDLIAKQLEMAKLDEARQGAVIQVVDKAVPPDKISSPKRAITIAVATLLGFFAACGWCMVADGLQRLKGNPEEWEKIEALRATFR